MQSFGLLRAVRNAAVLKYNKLCLTKGWSDAKALMATREFKVSPARTRCGGAAAQRRSGWGPGAHPQLL